MDFIQLLASGLANGCVYGLIALGFVLIYKATVAVNFAQGDFMMLGAFVCIGFANDDFMGQGFWIAVPLAILVMAVFGYLFKPADPAVSVTRRDQRFHGKHKTYRIAPEHQCSQLLHTGVTLI